MRIEFHGPSSPVQHGALFTLLVHNAKDTYTSTWAVELAILRFWGWAWQLKDRALFFVCGPFGGVILAGGQAKLRSGRRSAWD